MSYPSSGHLSLSVKKMYYSSGCAFHHWESSSLNQGIVNHQTCNNWWRSDLLLKLWKIKCQSKRTFLNWMVGYLSMVHLDCKDTAYIVGNKGSRTWKLQLVIRYPNMRSSSWLWKQCETSYCLWAEGAGLPGPSLRHATGGGGSARPFFWSVDWSIIPYHFAT
jgi:hypothetical protein